MLPIKLIGALTILSVVAMASSAVEAKPASGNVTYRPAPAGTIKYADGTTVIRHADGSCEVSDGDSYQTAPRTVSHVKSVKRKAKASAKKHK